MCIIIVKPSGVELPDTKELVTCDTNNPDGMGFMTPINGMVRIEKGFLDAKTMAGRIDKVLKKHAIDGKNTTIVYHFRLATHGEKSAAACHPFPLSNSKKYLQQTVVNCNTGVVHNGVLGLKDNEHKELSDTQIFIRDYLSAFSFNEIRSKRIQAILDIACEGQKIVLMNGKGELIYLGDTTWTTKDSRLYSNSSYIARDFYLKGLDSKHSYMYGDELLESCDLCGAETLLSYLWEDGIAYSVCRECWHLFRGRE